MDIRTYALQPNFSTIEFDRDEQIWFGDPCYVVPGWNDDVDLWTKLCDKMFHQVTKQHPDTGEIYNSTEYDFDDKNNIRVVETKDGKFYMWSTESGDGTYPLTHHHNRIAALGVDAGCLSLVPRSLIEKWGKMSSAESLGHFVDDHRKACLDVDGGDMYWGDYNLLTSWEASRDMEEEDEWMCCDEESYV